MNTFSFPWRRGAFLARIVLLSTMLSSIFLSFSQTLAQTATFRNPLNNSGPDPWMTYYI